MNTVLEFMLKITMNWRMSHGCRFVPRMLLCHLATEIRQRPSISAFLLFTPLLVCGNMRLQYEVQTCELARIERCGQSSFLPG